MLCAPEQVLAQVAHRPHSTHSNNNNNNNGNSNNNTNDSSISTSRNIPLLHDPYDPRIEQEYEQLVQRWTRQLLVKSRNLYSNYSKISNVPVGKKSHTSSMTNMSSYNSNENNNSHHKLSVTSSLSEGPGATTNLTTNKHLCYTDIIDHYLEEQWRDSQHMLKCAQAWNGCDSLSVDEAIRAMNIISLRLMQRTLETRQILQSNNISIQEHNGHNQHHQQQQQPEYTQLFSPWLSPRTGQHDHICTSSISSSSISSSSEEDGSVRWRPRHSPSLASLPKVPIIQDAPKGFVADKATTVPTLSLSPPTGENNSIIGDSNGKDDDDDDDNEEEEEQEMYAPLLRRYQTDSSISGGCEGSNNSSSSIHDWTDDKLKKKPSLQTIEKHAAAVIATSASPPDNSNSNNECRSPLRLVPSPSAPNCSSLTNGICCINSFIPATNYRRYYPEQHQREEDEEYGYDYSSEGSNNGSVNKMQRQQREHNQWKSWFQYQHSHQHHHHHQYHHHHHHHQEDQDHSREKQQQQQEQQQQEQQQQQQQQEQQRQQHQQEKQQQLQPLLLSQSPSSCIFCYNTVPKKSLSAGDAEETRFFPSSTSGDSSTEDNQSTSYHSAVTSDHVMLEEIEEYRDEDNNNETNALLSKNNEFFDSGKYLCEQEQANHDDKYNDLVSNYGIFGTSGGSSNSNSGVGCTGGMIRSESSISAFRPISKNLAPRCSAALTRGNSVSSSTSKVFLYRDSLSSSSSTQAASVHKQFKSKKGIPTITKSQSFPSKVPAMSIGSSSFSDSPTRPALPKMSSYSTSRGTGGEKRSSTSNNKERNFVMRSIVSKKASLSKLFHAKKY